ncbi:unnamed protein product [Adineta steineri]|uniref:Neurotransmitter-gated ion-channel ligand-binding domain-containing protein n=1 Tax=Adineta steineri TaxID=433720 RepID=A0A813T2P4_9BILA|nr:unnamed protein product [Adineta steineri]
MISFNWFLLIFCTVVYSQKCSDYYTCQLELYDRILNNSRPSIRPIQNDTEKINVRLGFSLIRLVSVKEEDSLFTIRAHLNQTWNAPILGWNLTAYSNVRHFRVPAHSIWTPKIELVNPSTVIDTEANHFININYDGLCELSYSTLLTIPCNFDLNSFPFDQQTCTFKMGSALYDINEVAITQAIDFVIDEPGLMPNGYSFGSHTVEQKPTFFAGFARTYDQIIMNFMIHRRSTYFLRLINWPKCSDYYTCQLELYDRVLNNSRPSIRPIQNDTEKINVRLGFSLIRLVSVKEEDSLFTIRAHLNQTWNAPILGWNLTAYSNVRHFRVPAHSIWTPKIELINPSTVIDTEANHFININSDGLCELSYSTLLTIPCNFDLNSFPFDQQTCTFKMGSALYDINEVAITQAIDFVIDEPGLMPNGYSFGSHTVEQKPTFFAGFARTYDQIIMNFMIHRRSTYFLRLINWPSSILILLTLTIFLLPPSASERIIYGKYIYFSFK